MYCYENRIGRKRTSRQQAGLPLSLVFVRCRPARTHSWTTIQTMEPSLLAGVHLQKKATSVYS
jgi:hypothetical protein